jgi:hypothetical protein
VRALSFVIRRVLGPLSVGLLAVTSFSGAAAPATAGPARALVSPPLSVADASVVEGSGAGTTTLSFVVSTTVLHSTDCGFRAVLTHGTTNNADFTSTAFFDVTAVWDTNDVTVPRSFTIARDVVFEPNETVTLTITGDSAHPNPCSIGDGVAIGTITNDDAAPGDETRPGGHTHGYWKTHPRQWPGTYRPTRTLTSVGFVSPACKGFGSLDLVRPNGVDTLLQALRYGGGSRLVGKGRVLLRSAVAALLNEASFGAAYRAYPSTAALIAAVNRTLRTCRGSAYASLTVKLNRWNQGLQGPG